MEFGYDSTWVQSKEARPLSLSLPINFDGTPLRGPSVGNFFENLLPDSEQIRQRIRVIDVRVRQDDDVDRPRLEAEREVLASRIDASTLVEATVQEQRAVRRVDEMARARDGLGGADKLNVDAHDAAQPSFMPALSTGRASVRRTRSSFPGPKKLRRRWSPRRFCAFLAQVRESQSRPSTSRNRPPLSVTTRQPRSISGRPIASRSRTRTPPRP